ncbi:L-lactate dehydrogenase [Mycoplasmopsis pulmonis]|uniref:L-lactate dehydrogenase n=1 Tax=Mycoplasmopsis pulmonis TaxID=2107 RepID=UPI00100507DF|nr:L-lactate dehydrogenase [Mycoplasmopsis pulmonis]VEU68523.1 l-lactate dehydrogenase [Mycoplasmopsis pulmonis]
MKKVVLIGTGNVGVTVVYTMITKGIDAEYVLIDINTEFAKGHAMDMSDAIALNSTTGSKIRTGTYADAKGADLLIVAAGRPQKQGETRLEMIADNSKIMKDIALEIKKSGFNGFTIVTSNPVDILATVFQKVTNFPKEKVMSSGTFLDTSRFRKFLSEKTGVPTNSVHGFVIGEHGDKSVVVFSRMQIGFSRLDDFLKSKALTEDDLKWISEKTYKEAYEIINRKRSTYFGIGASVAEMAESVLYNQRRIFPIGIYLDESKPGGGIYISRPAILGENGWEEVKNYDLSPAEQKAFDESAINLKKHWDDVQKEISF